MTTADSLQEKFKKRFGVNPRVFRAPGRVNLIGEHTDYNDGFVLPVAIQFSCHVAIARREDRKLVLHSGNFQQDAEIALADSTFPRRGDWSDFPAGVAHFLREAGVPLIGANLMIDGNVPLGAGLSSSAAIEVATALALTEDAGHRMDRTKLALLCQRAENEFVGARCGIMDQFIAVHAQKGKSLMLDCRSLHGTQLPLPPALDLVVCNTKVKHEHAANGYNTRRSECEQAVQRLRQAIPEIRALRDVSPEQLAAHKHLLTDVLYRRAKHVVTENARVLATAEALQSGNTSRLGSLLAEAHNSMRDDYEASCAELDLMVEIAAKQKGVHGSRVTGGGFGGCTVNLVERERTSEFEKNVAEEYARKTGLQPDIYICQASQGAEEVLP